MPNPPFSPSSNDLVQIYSELDAGGAAGDHRVNVPGNFGKVRQEILDLHTRLSVVEGATGSSAASSVSLKGECNGHFQVARFGPDYFVALPANIQIAKQNDAAFLPPYTGHAVTGGGLALVGYDYVQSAFPGWFMARDFFLNIGERVSTTGFLDGAKFTFLAGAAHAFDETEVTAAGNGDLPGIYQVLTRHRPIEAFQGRELILRVRYSHAAALPSGTSYRLYIAYRNAGGSRVTALSSSLSATTGSNFTDVTFSTANDASAFPDGVIPTDATAVEIGFVMDTHPGSPGIPSNDEWTFFHFLADVGSVRSSVGPPPRALDFLESASYYASPLMQDMTGKIHAAGHPLSYLFISPSPAIGFQQIEQYPWPLVAPWRSNDATLMTGVRVTEVIGAGADTRAATTGAPSGFELNFGTTDAWVIAVTNARSTLVAAEPFDVKGTVTLLQRALDVTPLSGSTLLTNIDMPYAEWGGEIVAGLSPINF